MISEIGNLRPGIWNLKSQIRILKVRNMKGDKTGDIKPRKKYQKYETNHIKLRGFTHVANKHLVKVTLGKLIVNTYMFEHISDETIL